MENSKLPANIYWFFLNIILPISPLLVKLFVFMFGKDNLTSNINILELPEAFFYSISASAVTISISVNGDKKIVDYFIIIFSISIIVLDLLALGMVYSFNNGKWMKYYSVLAFVMPTLIAISYKLYYKETGR